MAKWNVDLVTNTACTLTPLILLMNDEHGRSVDVHFTHELLPSTSCPCCLFRCTDSYALQPSSISPSLYNRKISIIIVRWLEEGSGGEGEAVLTAGSLTASPEDH